MVTHCIKTEEYLEIFRGDWIVVLFYNFYLRRSRKILLPIPQCTEDDIINADNVMSCPWCVDWAKGRTSPLHASLVAKDRGNWELPVLQESYGATTLPWCLNALSCAHRGGGVPLILLLGPFDKKSFEPSNDRSMSHQFYFQLIKALLKALLRLC